MAVNFFSIGSNFEKNCSIITQNIFAEHTSRRYQMGLAQKGISLAKKPIVEPIVRLTLRQAIASSVVGLGVGLGIVITGIGSSLSLFREARKKHYKMMAQCHVMDSSLIDDCSIIDVTGIEFDIEFDDH